MKLIKILGNYRKGVRLSSLFLIVLMSWSIFQGVFVFARFQHEISDTAVFQSAQSNNAYYVQLFISGSDVDLNVAEKAVEALRANPSIAHVFAIRYASPASYGNTNSGILLYEPEMLEFFPKLKSIGIDFSKNPDGCILGSMLFSELKIGEEVKLDFNQGGGATETASFKVTGRLSNPYTCMRFSTSSSVLKANNLFVAAGDVVIMQATDTVMSKLETLARRIQMESNFIVVFQEGVAVDEQEAILQEAAPKYVPFSFDRILENTLPSLRSQLAQALIQPLFLAIAALIAYLSILILTFKKKEKEMAVWYLCGSSRLKCALITFFYFSILALIPVLLNTALILFWPSINWDSLFVSVYITNRVQLMQQLGEENFLKLYGLILFFKDRLKIGNECLAVVFSYCGVSILLAFTATVGSMIKHTPLTYLRGANK